MVWHTHREFEKLLRLALPLLGAQVLATAMGAVDAPMAARYSSADLAAIALGSSFWLPLMLFLNGVLIASTTMVSRHSGAGQHFAVAEVIHQSAWVAGPLAGLFAVLLAVGDPLLYWISAGADYSRIADRYLNAIALGFPALAISGCLRSLHEGSGNTAPYMISAICAFVLNIPLNALFIFGLGLFPALGGEGCGWATAISWWLQAMILWWLTGRRGSPVRSCLGRGLSPPDKGRMLQIMGLGLPIALAVFAEVTIFSTIALMLAPMGAIVVAGHQVALTTSHIVFMLPLSFSQAITIRVGYYLGAAAPEMANRVIRLGLKFGAAMGMVTGSLLLLGRHQVIALYGVEPIVYDSAATLFVWMALYQVSDQIQVVSNAALRGYQDTRIPMLLVLACYWLLALPLGYVLGRTSWLSSTPMAAEGFWIGLLVGLSASAIMLSWRLRTQMRH